MGFTEEVVVVEWVVSTECLAFRFPPRPPLAGGVAIAEAVDDADDDDEEEEDDEVVEISEGVPKDEDVRSLGFNACGR